MIRSDDPRTIAAAARAEGETDRDFALPRRSADELETGDVRAGDEQDEERSADDEQQTFPVIADNLGRAADSA